MLEQIAGVEMQEYTSCMEFRTDIMQRYGLTLRP